MARPVIRIVLSSALVAVFSFSPAYADQGDCGQPASTGATAVATDALFVLGAAVGIQVCELCVCDVNDDGSNTATDALTVLASAVGQQVAITCPTCGSGPTPCFESQAPSCGGECEDPGLTCVVDPEDSEDCSCLNACEAGAAPTCGGSCEASDDPESICTSVNVSPTGLPTIAICECLPAGVSFCEDASSPQCEGECAVGAVCESDGGSGCQCTAQPVQPACSAATAPACNGTCENEPSGGPTLCGSDGASGCVCAPTQGGEETCFDAGVPTCGGTCSFGELCAVETDVCECVAPCEVSNAPSCGGACYDEDETCVITTISVGSASRDYCECWVVD